MTQVVVVVVMAGTEVVRIARVKVLESMVVVLTNMAVVLTAMTVLLAAMVVV